MLLVSENGFAKLINELIVCHSGVSQPVGGDRVHL